MMHLAPFSLSLCLLIAPPALAAITVEPTDGQIRVANGLVELRVDLATGALRGFGRRDDSPAVTGSTLTVLVEGAGGLSPSDARRLDTWRPLADGVDVDWSAAGWRVTEHWRLAEGSPAALRSATVVAPGAVITREVRFGLTGAHVPRATDTVLTLPHGFPIFRHALADNLPGADRNAGGSATNRLVLLSSRERRRSLLLLGDDGDDPSWAHVTEQTGSVEAEHVWNAQAELGAGQAMAIGTQVMTLAEDGPQAVAEAAWEAFDRLGRRVPADRPADVGRRIVYSAHAGGTIDSDWRDTGGFATMARRLDRLAPLGVNTLWLLPFWKGYVYAPIDYTRHDEALGDEAALRGLVATAGRRGIRVLADLVPHGPRPESGLLEQHPDWVSRDRAGVPIIWWGCLSCDYAHPGWQGYMADHAADWMERVGLSGYRVDVAGGGPANWRPHAGNRPSHSSIKGSHDLLTTVRRRIKQQDPGAMLIQEGTSPQLATTGDLVYDFPWAYEVLPRVLDMPLDEWCAALGDWLEARPAQYPRGTRFMRYVTSHDTIRGGQRYGVSLHRGLLLLTALVDGAPMLYDREEAGHEAALRAVYEARANLLSTAEDLRPESLRAGRPGLLVWRPKAGAQLMLLNMSDRDHEEVLPRGAARTWTRICADGARQAPWPAGQELRIRLAPGELGIVSERAWVTTPAAPPPPPTDAEPPPSPLPSLRAGNYTLRVDPRRGGAIAGLWHDGVCMADAETWREGDRKLFPGTPPLDLTAFSASVSQSPGRLECTGIVADKLKVTRRYEAREGLVCTLTLEALAPVEQANSQLRWVLPMRGERWRVETWEGVLAGTPDPGVSAGTPREWTGYRYRHPVGPLWRAATVPLAGALGVSIGTRSLSLSGLRGSPQDLFVTDNGHGVDVTMDWFNGRQPVTLMPGQPVSLTFQLGPPVPADAPVTCQGSNWHYRNRFYELVMGRSGGGSLRALRRLTGARPGASLMAGTNTYTDNGLYDTWSDPLGETHKVNVGSNLDVEPDVSVAREGRTTRLTFQGVLSGDRGFGMSIQQPHTWYRHEYLLTDGPSLRLRLAIRPRAGFEQRDVAAFAAHTLRFLRVSEWRCEGGDGAKGGAMPSDRWDRIWQSRERGGLGPLRFTLTIDGRPLTITLHSAGGQLQNAFLLSGAEPVLFLAHFDNRPERIAPRWREVDLEIAP